MSYEIHDVIDTLYRHWPALVASISAIATGALLMLDDVHDFPEPIHSKESKVDSPLGKLVGGKSLRNPTNLPHHWTIGLIGFLGGCVGLIVTLLQMLNYLQSLRAKREQVEMKEYSLETIKAMK